MIRCYYSPWDDLVSSAFQPISSFLKNLFWQVFSHLSCKSFYFVSFLQKIMCFVPHYIEVWMILGLSKISLELEQRKVMMIMTWCVSLIQNLTRWHLHDERGPTLAVDTCWQKMFEKAERVGVGGGKPSKSKNFFN